ncbi:hypothetical protein Q8G48_28375, partial [Klebsiella pneumoniae]|uniref:hypothetical protein n=1 Tax=Klebsiella pneumoniae TaxID=573 RepID=UPI003013530F
IVDSSKDVELPRLLTPLEINKIQAKKEYMPKGREWIQPLFLKRKQRRILINLNQVTLKQELSGIGEKITREELSL